MATDCFQQLTFWKVGKQEVRVDFNGGPVVTDTGLLPIRLLDKELGVLSGIASRLPDPRAQKLVSHSCEAILTQDVYQILAGYPDAALSARTSHAATSRSRRVMSLRNFGARRWRP